MFFEKTKLKIESEDWRPLKPFLSVFLIVASMFIVVLANSGTTWTKSARANSLWPN